MTKISLIEERDRLATKAINNDPNSTGKCRAQGIREGFDAALSIFKEHEKILREALERIMDPDKWDKKLLNRYTDIQIVADMARKALEACFKKNETGKDNHETKIITPLNHPCRGTCSGWQAGVDSMVNQLEDVTADFLKMREKSKELMAQLAEVRLMIAGIHGKTLKETKG